MTPETEDQLRQYFRDATATVDGRPELVRDAVHTGKARLRRRRSAAVGAAVAASLGIALMVPIIQSTTDPDQHQSSPAASAPITALPRIATSSWRLGDDVSPLFALLHDAPLGLSSDGQCLVVGDRRLVVWPAGYSVVLRDGDVTVLDETGAEAARVGDLITVVGGPGDIPADACGLSSAFHIQSRVSSASSDARSRATDPATGNDAKTVEVSGDFLMSGGPSPGRDVPLSGTVVFESSDTTLRVTVGSSGHFQVRVPPGRYQVTGTSPHINGGQTQCRQVSPLDARPGGVNNVHVICFVA